MISDRFWSLLGFFPYFCYLLANRWERLNHEPNHSLSFCFLCSFVTLLLMYFLSNGKSSPVKRVRKGKQRR